MPAEVVGGDVKLLLYSPSEQCSSGLDGERLGGLRGRRRPELPLGPEDDVARRGKDGLAIDHQPTEVVGVCVRDDDDVHLIRLNARSAQRVEELSRTRACSAPSQRICPNLS